MYSIRLRYAHSFRRIVKTGLTKYAQRFIATGVTVDAAVGAAPNSFSDYMLQVSECCRLHQLLMGQP